MIKFILVNLVQTMYTDVLPIVTLIAFIIVISLQLYKRDVYKNIEKKFFKTLDNNQKLSEVMIQKYFQKTNEQTDQMLQHLNNETQHILDQSTNDILKLQTQLRQTTKIQQLLNQRLNDFQEETTLLHNKLQEKNAIIERKSRQIKRLKGTKK